VMVIVLRRSPMEPEAVIIIVCGILLALTLLPGTPKRASEPKDVEIVDCSQPEELRRCLE